MSRGALRTAAAIVGGWLLGCAVASPAAAAGHMSWGHAVSPDLVHWHELSLAIPEDDRYMIFSGSIGI